MTINGIVDEKVYKIKEDPQLKNSIALSKERFAQMILDEVEFAHDFDFSNFTKIFDVINEIIKD